MITILFTWVSTALTILLSTQLLPGIAVESFKTALVISLVWGLLNIFIKPIIVLLTLPINILTLGLFTFVINGFLFWLTSTFVQGFSVATFLDALLATIFISAVSFFVQKIIRTSDE